MRRYYSVILLCALCIFSTAQTINLYKNGNIINTYTLQEIDSIVFSKQTPEQQKYVDLGLPSGTLWATCNVGADSPEEYGLYFAWGETTGFSCETDNSHKFDWPYYKWCNNGSSSSMSKYCTSSFYGIVDELTELGTTDDAATVILGKEWRMPSKKQIDELSNTDYTKATWTSQNDVYGELITSKVNGNSIFIPAAGYWSNSCPNGTMANAYYWTRDLHSDYSNCAYYMYFDANVFSWRYLVRCYGLPIRPVYVPDSPEVKVEEIKLDETSLSLSVGNECILTPTFIPSDATDKSCKWSSSNPYVASVTTMGTVMAESPGNATITCTALDGSGVIATCDVFVIDDHESVDLGLPSGTLWATCNVGADKPEDYGDYFAWGEVEPKETYTIENYKYGTPHTTYSGALYLYKYCSDATYGDVDNLTEMLYEDDAARYNWGGKWRMPTVLEQDELRDYCTWTKETLNDINGYRIVGPNGNSIFIPFAGFINKYGNSNEGKWFEYNSSRISRYGRSNDSDGSAICLLAMSNDVIGYCSTSSRYVGVPVRPVCGTKHSLDNELAAVDLGLSVKWANKNVGASQITSVGNLFAWGEVSTKESFSWDNYKYGTESYVTKYCLNSTYGDYDGKRFLDPEDDAATVNLGDDWRMPTNTEMQELFSNCTYTKTTVDTYPGYRFWGTNGNSIFFPSGYLFDSYDSYYPTLYQTSELYEYNESKSIYNYSGWIINLSLNKPITTYSWENRSCGKYVRGIQK